MSIVKNYYGNDITKIKIEIETADIQKAINFLKNMKKKQKKEEK
ncbi:hypothetical protein [Spiroplasma endosymbiont of Seladonia tumulorum]